ncbi:MAG: hypothetical protein P8Q91_06445 [Porticoccaceae bacterium]|nr:hypothetical protein [Porticoccaceae bacterium]
MKKIVLGLMLLSPVSFADNLSFVGADYFRISGFGESVDGYRLSAMNVFSGKTAVGLSYIRVSENGVSADVTALNADYAFGSFNDGSFYIGGSVQDSDAGSDAGVAIGYAKISGEGLDFNVSVAHVDGESALGVVLRGPLGDSGLGWNLGASTDGDLSSQSAGINFKF